MNIDFVEKIGDCDEGYMVTVRTSTPEEFNELRKFVCRMDADGNSANVVNKALYGDRESVESNDAVNHPNHYQGKGGLEVYDIMRGFMTDDEVKGWHKACTLKYILRAGKKDPSKLNEDLNKAIWHLIEWNNRTVKKNKCLLIR